MLDQIKTAFANLKPNEKILLMFYNSERSSGFVTRINNSYLCYKPFGQSTEWLGIDDIDEISDYKIVKKNFRTKVRQLWRTKKPKTTDNYVGIELEFISKLNVEALEVLFAEADLEEYCQLKEDGSIDESDDYPYAHEVCILVKESQVSRIVNKVCAVLKPHSKVNSSCGMHVHLDMRNRNKTLAFDKLYSAQKLLFSMVPASRLHSSYCDFIQGYDYEEFNIHPVTENRYVGINTRAYRDHKTIEIRMHSGSLDAEKIINWVTLLRKIVNNTDLVPKVSDRPIMWNSLKDVRHTFKLNSRLTKYLKERINKFKYEHDKDLHIVL